jgi:hypothetical protein
MLFIEPLPTLLSSLQPTALRVDVRYVYVRQRTDAKVPAA